MLLQEGGHAPRGARPAFLFRHELPRWDISELHTQLWVHDKFPFPYMKCTSGRHRGTCARAHLHRISVSGKLRMSARSSLLNHRAFRFDTPDSARNKMV